MTRECITLAEHVAWREVDGEVLLLDFESTNYVSVNATGTLLWPLLVHGTTVDDLAAALRSAHDLDEQRAVADAGSFVRMLTDQGLVRRDGT